MRILFRTAEAILSRARFDGEDAKRLRMPRDANPYPPGRCFRAWSQGWDSIARWRRTDFREAANSLDRPTPPRPCPDPNPRRIPYE